MRLHVRMLRQPDAFAACFGARYVQAAEFRLHYRPAQPGECEPGPRGPGCCLGLVVPKKFCKSAVRRNLIKRSMRQALREVDLPSGARMQAPVLMLRLTRKLPPEFDSAASAPLRRHVRDAIGAMLTGWMERGVSLAPSPEPRP